MASPCATRREVFASWVNESSVIELILGGSVRADCCRMGEGLYASTVRAPQVGGETFEVHAELLRRCEPLLEFMAQAKALTSAQLDVLWHATGSGDLVRRRIFALLPTLVAYLTWPQVKQLFAHIEPLAREDLDEVRVWCGLVAPASGQCEWEWRCSPRVPWLRPP